MRNFYPCEITVSPTATSVTITPDFIISELVVTSLSVLKPIYFRVDGRTAVVGANGQPICNGYGGSTTIDINNQTSLTISLISEGTGKVHLTVLEAL